MMTLQVTHLLRCRPTFFEKTASGARPQQGNRFSRRLVMRLPAAGNAIARGWHFEYPRLALRVPAAGTSSARGWHFECLRLALRVPAAGTSIPKGWEHDSQRLGTLFPRAGNTIPKGWENDSQRLGTLFPRAGNMIPKGWEFDSQGLWDFESPSSRWFPVLVVLMIGEKMIRATDFAVALILNSNDVAAVRLWPSFQSRPRRGPVRPQGR